MIKDGLENPHLALIIFIYYRFLDEYRSREEEFKKISNQEMMKKRIYQKAETNIFAE